MSLPTVNDSPQTNSPNRRAFLQKASLMTAVAAGIASDPILGVAEDAEVDEAKVPSTNQVEKLELSVKPSVHSTGAVLVPRIHNSYVTFHATQYGVDGNAGVDGTAVIQLAVCVQRKFRSKGDEATAEHSIDLDSLELCEAYEVLKSTWAAKWNDLPGGNSEGDGDVRHFIFTFLGFCPGVCTGTTHFECLAADAQVHFFQDASFEEVLLYIDSLESVGSKSSE